MRRCAKVLMVVGAILIFAGIATAQDGDIREVTSPFTEEFDYEIGRTLDLNVRISGITWKFLRIGAGDEADWVAGETVKASFTLELENLTEESLSLSVIVLLEDERGRQLERVRFKKIKVGSGRAIEEIQRIKVDGGALSETSKVYFFAEVE